MSFFKYFRETHDADGEQLFWPGGPDGFPFRGSQPPLTKQEEFDSQQLSSKLRCKLFYLSKPEDLKEYTVVRDKCANGLFVPVDRDRVWDEETKNYRIFLEWLEPAYEQPSKVTKDAIHEYVQKPQGNTFPFGRLAGLQQNGW